MSDASLQQSLGQQQTLTPQMRRSLEILQANSFELSQLIHQALETNPVLESEEPDAAEPLDPAADSEAGDLDNLSRLNETDDDFREASILAGRADPWTRDDEERREHLYNSIVAPHTLQSHLLGQIRTAAADPDVRDASEILLGALDERGFFAEAPEDAARQFDIPRETRDKALALLRSLDPPGVGARDLRDSLLIQLDRAGLGNSVESRIVEKHLEDLARKRHQEIARSLGTTPERIAEAAGRIARLNPNPGGDFDPTGNPEILPDIVIARGDDGQFHASLTTDYLPRLKITPFYKDLVARIGSDAEARRYLRDHIREGRSLLHAISLRQETILSIAARIVARQEPFLELGPRHLRPMTMSEIAGDLGIHPTTVSRAVAGKYAFTPHGLMELRAFFTAGYKNADGSEISNSGVRQEIQRIVAREDPASPLSDEAIHKALAKQGLSVSRRTVSKYRRQLGIPSSHLRKSTV
jgi:RNA polymerase sigma-54 factor